MKKALSVLVLGFGLPLFAGDKLVMRCGAVPSENIEYIEVYETATGGSVMVQEADEVGTVLWLDVDDLCLSVECTIDLPGGGSKARVLDNRHTGWKLTTYNGGVSHLDIECDENP